MTQLHTALKFDGTAERVHSDALHLHQFEGRAVDAEIDDFAREVYGVLGIPVDAVEMADAVRMIERAAARGRPFLLSTPNLNFLIGCQSDARFRESLLKSDLCTADGMPVVWLARLLGMPIRTRVAGSDIFEALKARGPGRALKLFLFGGEDGVAERACEMLRDGSSGLRCVGFHNPGFGSIDDMSTDAIFEKINASDADILAVSLGAQKGQAWLLRNHDRLQVPVRSHLGATINFQAGTVKRAPAMLRRFGLEWLWRIREEPALWRRYFRDGLALAKIMLLRVVPLVAVAGWRWVVRKQVRQLGISQNEAADCLTISLHGDATSRFVPAAAAHFRSAAGSDRRINVDFSDVTELDARFIGCLLMLRKQRDRRHQSLEFVGISPRIKGIFRRNGFGYLLTASA